MESAQYEHSKFSTVDIEALELWASYLHLVRVTISEFMTAYYECNAPR